MLKISVKINQKAALLAGKALNSYETVDVSPETIGEKLWPILVEHLDMSKSPPALTSPAWSNPQIESNDSTAQAVVVAIAAHLELVEKRELERIKRLEDSVAEVEARVVLSREAILAPMVSEKQKSDNRGDSFLGCEFMGFTRAIPELNWYSYGMNALPEPFRARAFRARDEWESIYQKNKEELRIANEAAYVSAIPDMTFQKSERERVEREQVESEAAALAEANKKRIESGVWEKETDSYNERRYSSPWCAKVSFPAGAKPHYEFGESTGKWGKSGLLRIDCKPGEVIAWGQKDLRRPDRSDHELFIMREDGNMESITKTEAFRVSQKS